MVDLDVTIAVATYGSVAWFNTARQVAIPSAERFGCPVVYQHGKTLHEARNAALEDVKTEYVIFLDADDQLDRNYLYDMAQSTAMRARERLVRIPQVIYRRPDGDSVPGYPRVAGHTHNCKPACLLYGNYIVIGAMVTTSLIREVGGFRDFGWEDWDLFVRCYQQGAHFVRSSAIYIANVRAGSRGGYSAEESLRHHIAVAKANGLPIPSIARQQP